MLMTLGRFAAAVSAPRKWILNAHAVLELDRVYSVERAKIFTMVSILESVWSLPLKRAYELALEMEALPDDGSDWRIVGRDGLTTLSIDRNRFLSRFAATLSYALEGYAERRSGRPRKSQATRVNAAEAYGVDLSLLETSLSRTPAERLRSLDHDAAFLGKLKIVES